MRADERDVSAFQEFHAEKKSADSEEAKQRENCIKKKTERRRRKGDGGREERRDEKREMCERSEVQILRQSNEIIAIEVVDADSM